MPSANVFDSGSGKYKLSFREAAVRFVSQFPDEPWELRGLEQDGRGLSVDLKLKTENGAWVIFALVRPGPAMAQEILELMERAHQSYVDSQVSPDSPTHF